MSKSIYDEALLDLRMNDSMRVAGQHVLTRNQYSNVFKAIEQAQKQERLLELYRKHYKLVPFMPGLGDNAKTVIDNSRKIEQIEKELENDK